MGNAYQTSGAYYATMSFDYCSRSLYSVVVFMQYIVRVYMILSILHSTRGVMLHYSFLNDTAHASPFR
jgi:hypothetical protein